MDDEKKEGGCILQRANECPKDKYLNKYVRVKVCAACANNPEIWRDLGIELMGQEGVAKLDEIKANNNGNVTKCCSAMFSLWLQMQPKANWNQLMEALKEVKLITLADEIKKLLMPSMEQQHTEHMQSLQVNYNGDKKDLTARPAQVSKEQHSWDQQQQQQQQQEQVNRSSTAFSANFTQKWQKSPQMPEKCCVTSVAEMDGKVYTTALLSDSRFVPFVYDIKKKQWSPMLTLSGTSYFVFVAVHDTKQLLAIGGSTHDGMSNKVFLWDEKHNKWIIQYPDMLIPRCSVTGICHHSTMVVAGGITHWNPWTLTRVVEVLHINDDSPSDSYWSTVEQLPHTIYGAIPLLCGDNLYISSVVDYVCPQDKNTFILLTASVSKLLKSSNTNNGGLWNKLPDVPYSSYSIICYQSYLITFTGFRLAEQAAKVLKMIPQIHIYNPDTLSWDYVGDATCGYVLGMSVYVGENKILFMGGITGSYNVYDSFNWVHANLQLELTAVSTCT